MSMNECVDADFGGFVFTYTVDIWLWLRCGPYPQECQEEGELPLKNAGCHASQKFFLPYTSVMLKVIILKLCEFHTCHRRINVALNNA